MPKIVYTWNVLCTVQYTVGAFGRTLCLYYTSGLSAILLLFPLMMRNYIRKEQKQQITLQFLNYSKIKKKKFTASATTTVYINVTARDLEMHFD